MGLLSWKFKRGGVDKTSLKPPTEKNISSDSTPYGSSAGSPKMSTSDSRSPSVLGERRNTGFDSVKNQVMVNYLYQQQGNSGWRSEAGKKFEGVLLRVAREQYLAYPPDLLETQLAASLCDLNVSAAMTINSPVIRSFLESMPETQEIPLLNGLAVQVVANLEALGRARPYQFAACVASESLLVVWDDDAVNMLARAKSIEWELMQILWSSPVQQIQSVKKAVSKVDIVSMTTEQESITEYAEDPEILEKPRPIVFINTIYSSISVCLMFVVIGLGFRQLIIETVIEMGSNDPVQYTRFALLAITPIWMFFGIFFFNVIVSNVAECIGPISQMHNNSKHYSAKTVGRITKNLPHVTIQMPVYKESLKDVIQPTIQSLKKAISTYELQGGSANIFCNDDGLQLLGEYERDERIAFYADNGIGWVARPAHSNEPDGFQRKGKFKKASNMNFALSLSCAVEDLLLDVERTSDWTSMDEAEATSWALQQAVADGGNLAWADGNIRVGDYILIIDSDTRVPKDCILDAVSEMELAPEVAILQFSSGVMNVTGNYFENGITFFTNLVYSAIRFAVANGDVAPFVGHNAVLRWSAVQDVAFEEDGRTKFWSESHVSEDFDIALRLQIKGYITRLAAWAGDGFQEGVSLTVYDELARWQKYAYGCNELMFNPLRFWVTRSPFTPLFRKFLGSNMPIASKINIIAYIGTYYAIGAAWILTTVNYFVIGWYKGYIDKYYINSWNIWITLIIVFNGLGNVALATLRYRIGERGFISALWENLCWLPMMFIFLGGISIHVSEALLAHMFEVNMSWGVTAKTLEFTNFFIEIPKMLKNFWFSMSFSLLMMIGMIVLAEGSFVPESWHITQLESIAPMSSLIGAHILLPLALNPGLMTFAW